jgi:hypothetical protein
MMATDKQPPIRYEGRVSTQELGQIRPPSRAEMQSRLQAAERPVSEQQASATRVQQVTNRAMEYVQAKTNDAAGRTAQAASRPTETPGLANREQQRDNLRDASRAMRQEQSKEKEKSHER